MQVYKFLDKNYDQVRQDVLDLFIQSKNKVSGEERQRPSCLSVHVQLQENVGALCVIVCVRVHSDGVEPVRGSR